MFLFLVSLRVKQSLCAPFYRVNYSNNTEIIGIHRYFNGAKKHRAHIACKSFDRNTLTVKMWIYNCKIIYTRQISFIEPQACQLHWLKKLHKSFISMGNEKWKKTIRLMSVRRIFFVKIRVITKFFVCQRVLQCDIWI